MDILFSMTYYSFSALFNLITSLLMTIIILANNPKTTTNRAFSGFTLGVAWWALFYFLWQIAPDIKSADFYLRTCMIGAMIVPAFFTHFVFSLLRQNTTSLLKRRLNNKSLLIGNYLISIFFIATAYTPLFAKEGGPYMSFNYWLLPGPLFHVHLLHFGLNVIYSQYLMFRSVRESHGIFRNQVLYVLVGSLITFSTGMTNYFYWYRIPIPPVLSILVSAYTILVTYSIIKHRLMGINIVFKKGSAYVLSVLLVLIPIYLILLWTQNFFFKTINISYSIIIVCLLIVAVIAFYRIRLRAEVAIEKVLFSNKYDSYKVLSNFTKEMVSVLTLNELLEKTINTFVETLKIKKASIFLFDEEKKAYIMWSAFGFDEGKGRINIKEQDALINYFLKKKDVAIREEIERYPSTQITQEIIKILREMESEIAIPFMEKDKVVGFCNLGVKGDRGMYSHEDIELFLSLGRQASIAIKNAQLIERIKESKHIIRRMERLKTIGDMAAGLAHEIRNPLVPIKTCLQLLPERYGKDEEFTEKIPMRALQEVERIEALLKEIMDYSRPRAPVLKDEDINDIVEKTVIFVEYEAKKKGIKIERKYENQLPMAKVDNEQIKQVILNLIFNAIDAVNGDGKIEITTRKTKHILSPTGRIGEKEYIQIEVTDNGMGIPEENIERIFNPFYTTKHESKEREGTGLGLSIVQEIVTEHNGFIQVKSELGKGTTFLVNLPIDLSEFEQREDRRRA